VLLALVFLLYLTLCCSDADLAEVMVKVEGEEPRAAGPPLNVLGTMQPVREIQILESDWLT